MAENKKKAADGGQLPKSVDDSRTRFRLVCTHDDTRAELVHIRDNISDIIPEHAPLYKMYAPMIRECRQYIEKIIQDEHEGQTIETLPDMELWKIICRAYKMKQEAEIEELQEYINQVLYSDDSEWLTLEEAEEKGELEFLLRLARALKEEDEINAELKKYELQIDAELQDKSSPFYGMTEISGFKDVMKLLELAKKRPLKISYRKTYDFIYTTDIFSRDFIHETPQIDLVKMETDYQILRYSRNGGEDVFLKYQYSFNDEFLKQNGIKRGFDGEADIIRNALDTQFFSGNNLITPTKIWHEIGHTGNPKKENIDHINQIFMMGMSTMVKVDISELVSAWGLTDQQCRELGINPKEPLISAAMPLQKIPIQSFMVRGITETDGAVYMIMGYSPFRIVEMITGRLTSWNKSKIFCYDGKKNERYYNVLSYIMWRVQYMQSKGKGDNKILLDSLYDACWCNSKRDRQLTLATTRRVIDGLVQGGILKKYMDAPKTEKAGLYLYW